MRLVSMTLLDWKFALVIICMTLVDRKLALVRSVERPCPFTLWHLCGNYF
jgi:hypothetical protein